LILHRRSNADNVVKGAYRLTLPDADAGPELGSANATMLLPSFVFSATFPPAAMTTN
jgi:hypothetical protein